VDERKGKQGNADKRRDGQADALENKRKHDAEKPRNGARRRMM
jgi:hypothetical protein